MVIGFVRKLSWRNASEGAPETRVYKDDLLRYENGIGDLVDLVDEGRLSDAELANTYAPKGSVGGTSTDNGSKLKGQLDLKQAATMFVASDSTGDAVEEWVHKWVEKLAVQRPELRSAYYGWNDTTQALTSAEIINAGGPKPRNTIVDTFTRTAPDVVGTKPDVGQTWTGQSGSWSLDGTNAARVAATAVSEVATRGGLFGDMTATFKGVVLNTNADTAFRWNRFIVKYLDTNNYLYLNVGISTGGGRLWSIEQRIGGTTTVITQGANNPPSLPGTTPALALPDVTVGLVGLAFSASIGSDTVTGTIPQATADALALGDGIGMRADNQLGMLVGEVRLAVTASSEATKTLAVYNGAKPGSDLSYQTSRLAAMCPTAPDLILISSSHNYAVGGAAYATAVDAFVTQCLTLWPNAGVAVMSQNPRKLPASAGGNQVHIERCAALKELARKRGWGYVPVMEAFLARPDQGYSLVNSDGVHPSADGSLLWRDTVSAWFDTLPAV